MLKEGWGVEPARYADLNWMLLLQLPQVTDYLNAQWFSKLLPHTPALNDLETNGVTRFHSPVGLFNCIRPLTHKNFFEM